MVRINVSICLPVSFTWLEIDPMIKVAVGEAWGKMSLINVAIVKRHLSPCAGRGKYLSSQFSVFFNLAVLFSLWRQQVGCVADLCFTCSRKPENHEGQGEKKFCSLFPLCSSRTERTAKTQVKVSQRSKKH